MRKKRKLANNVIRWIFFVRVFVLLPRAQHYLRSLKRRLFESLVRFVEEAFVRYSTETRVVNESQPLQARPIKVLEDLGLHPIRTW